MADYRVIERPRRDRLGEGPLWSPREGALYWVDILDPHLNRLDVEGGGCQAIALSEPTGWVIERRAEPGFVAGAKSGFKLMTLDPLEVVALGDPEPDLPENRMNDAKADAAGRVWAGTMGDGETPSGSFYRLDADHSWRKVDDGYAVANGPAISPDGRTLLHTDSHRGVIWRFDLSDDGELAGKRPLIRFEAAWGSPDGMTYDAEGGLWVAHWGAGCVSRFDDQGRRERWIDLPASQITSMAFAGAALDRLFVTSAADGKPDEPLAGALFEVDPGVKGSPPLKFAG
jgi:sugar lactone lactonase YvrE